MKDEAKAVCLDCWLYPQEFPIVVHVRDIVKVYYRCIDEKFNFSNIVCLKFSNVWFISAQRHLKFGSYQNIAEHNCRSYYLQIKESTLLEKISKERTEWEHDWKKYDSNKYIHFIVEGHDFYHNIIASKVKIRTIKKKKTIKKLYKIWNKV